MKLRMTPTDRCRICGSSSVRPFVDFTDYPLADNILDSPDDPREVLARYQAHWCADCRTAQNLTDFDWSSYYGAYDYTVSTSGFARAFMEQLAESVIARYGLSPGASVVELGSGDGYQLDCFRRRGLRVFGYEPGRGLAEAARQRGVATTTALFKTETLGEIPADLRPVSVFLSSYTFDHLPDPLGALRAMRSVLAPRDGLVIIEVHDLEQIIARREACLLCHEHTIYLSRESLGRLMARAGLKLISVDLVPDAQRRGNSLLAVGVPDESPRQPELPPNAALAALDRWETYERFGGEVAAAHAGLAEYVQQRVQAGQRVAGYGASARAISTLALAGLSAAEVEFVCDANPALHGRFLPRSHVPIRPPAALLDEPIDEVIVFAYGYMDEIRTALQAFTARGGRLVSLLDLLRR